MYELLIHMTTQKIINCFILSKRIQKQKATHCDSILMIFLKGQNYREIKQISGCKDPGSLMAQRVKSPPAMQETQVPSLGWEDPLEKEIATHSSILAWRIPWREEPGRLQSMGWQRLG